MPAGNTHARYGAVSKSLHWLTALLILTVIPLGLIANDLAQDIRNPDIATTAAMTARTALLFSLHKTLGVTIFAVALVRILWALVQPKPAPLYPGRRLETLLAQTVHWLLYGSLLLVPLSGWVHHASTTGFAPIWWPFGQSLPCVPQNDRIAELSGALHRLLVQVLGAALALHVLGALKHHFIDRDTTFLRMWPGGAADSAPTSPAPRGTHHSAAPAIAALAVWGLALSVGYVAGTFPNPREHHAPDTALPMVQSEWQVTDGTIEITISQMGSPVVGRFEAWTAQISYSDTNTPGPVGAVETRIAVESLVLGSVTKQAVGADFLDAQQHPVAVFSAPIIRTDTGLQAPGTLTLRGTTLPLTLPFTLKMSGDTAHMKARVVIDRMDFGIGTTTRDAATLGFDVDVSIHLTAQRQTGIE